MLRPIQHPRLNLRGGGPIVLVKHPTVLRLRGGGPIVLVKHPTVRLSGGDPVGDPIVLVKHPTVHLQRTLWPRQRMRIHHISHVNAHAKQGSSERG